MGTGFSSNPYTEEWQHENRGLGHAMTGSAVATEESEQFDTHTTHGPDESRSLSTSENNSDDDILEIDSSEFYEDANCDPRRTVENSYDTGCDELYDDEGYDNEEYLEANEGGYDDYETYNHAIYNRDIEYNDDENSRWSQSDVRQYDMEDGSTEKEIICLDDNSDDQNQDEYWSSIKSSNGSADMVSEIVNTNRGDSNNDVSECEEINVIEVHGESFSEERESASLNSVSSVYSFAIEENAITTNRDSSEEGELNTCMNDSEVEKESLHDAMHDQRTLEHDDIDDLANDDEEDFFYDAASFCAGVNCADNSGVKNASDTRATIDSNKITNTIDVVDSCDASMPSIYANHSDGFALKAAVSSYEAANEIDFGELLQDRCDKLVSLETDGLTAGAVQLGRAVSMRIELINRKRKREETLDGERDAKRWHAYESTYGTKDHISA